MMATSNTVTAPLPFTVMLLPSPSMVTPAATVRVEPREIVPPAMAGANTIVSPSRAAASAARREPAPVSSVLVTVRVVGDPVVAACASDVM